MNIANITVDDVLAGVSACSCITSGMVGVTVTFTYADPIWEDLNKTAVFTAGNVTRDVPNAGEVVTVSAEVLANPYVKLFAGIYGTDDNGELVLPTVMTPVGMILPGADPSGDPGVEPELPVWAQLQRDIEVLKLACGVSAFGPEDAGCLLHIASDGSIQALGLGDGLVIANGVLTLAGASGRPAAVTAEIVGGVYLLCNSDGAAVTAELSEEATICWPGMTMRVDSYGVVSFEEE